MKVHELMLYVSDVLDIITDHPDSQINKHYVENVLTRIKNRLESDIIREMALGLAHENKS